MAVTDTGPGAPAVGSDPHGPTAVDHLARHYDRLGELTDNPVSDYLTARLPAERRPGSRAVELGCGTGRHATLLATRFDEVLAVDLSQPMIDFARRHRPAGSIRYEARDLHDVAPDWDGWFDLVLTIDTLHHLIDPHTALTHMRELVAPGGQAIVIDRCGPPRTAGWYRLDALRTLAADLRSRRRTVTAACELYRLSTDPAWLAQQSAAPVLSPGQFDAVCTTVFPDAEITPLPPARAMHWQHSTRPAGGSSVTS